MIYRVVSILSLLDELDESTIWQLRQISNATSSGRANGNFRDLLDE